MGMLLTLADLFFIGSLCGWVIELLFRNLVHRSEKWINPGFCTGPYIPIYGFGLCVLFLLAQLEQLHLIANPFWNKMLLFGGMAIGMTLIEYIAGIFCLKYLKVRLWDYSRMWGNIQGIICPTFSVIWAVLGAVYYFLIHDHILNMLHWLSQNLAFSFFIGVFFGIFIIDVAHSANLAVKLKAYAEEHRLVVRYEELKEHIRQHHIDMKNKYHFFSPFHSEMTLREHLAELYETREIPVRKKHKKKHH